MVATASDILTTLSCWAPLDTAESWDNCGLQVGDLSKPVNTILVALEIDKAVLERLQHSPVDLVITHHPIIFRPLQRLDVTTDIGQILQTCIQTNTAVISMHTNLDVAKGGVTDCLLAAYGLDSTQAKPMASSGLGRYLSGSFSPDVITSRPYQKIVGTLPDTISKIGFCGGSGKSLLSRAAQLGVGVFVTGEIGYHDEVWCGFSGLCVVVLGHKESEDVIVPEIAKRVGAAHDVLVDVM